MTPFDSLSLAHLRTLNLLLAERSVTRAAHRLGISQSAMSHKLRFLRKHLDDPLLVRGATGLIPTARATALEEPLRLALQAMAAALAVEPAFDPSTASGPVRVSLPDYAALILGGRLLQAVADEAPGVELAVSAPPLAHTGLALERGALDLHVEIVTPEGPGIHTRALYQERFACAVRADHPIADDGLDLDSYTRLPHLLSSPGSSGPGVVDHALDRLGLSRRVVMRAPFFVVLPLLLGSTDGVLTAPERVLRAVAELAPIRVLRPPLELPGFVVRLFWHASVQGDGRNRWLRGLVVRAAQ